jgi:hypothetical protein
MQVIPSVAASRAPLAFGGVPAIRLRHRGFGGLVLTPFDIAHDLRHFEHIAQSFARGKLL